VSTGVVETANNNTLVLLGIAGDETDAGFRVTAVWPGSLTGQVDLKPGDVVSKINNKRVYNGRDIESAIAANPGATIILDYQIRGIWLIEKEIRVR
jgi:S1-C subfamily serine protease